MEWKPETLSLGKVRGEISPKEFGLIVGKEMVLAHGHRVAYAPSAKRLVISSCALGLQVVEGGANIRTSETPLDSDEFSVSSQVF
jgi:hypothetical protein